ncbi:AraC family transcriptional regulator [Sphingobium sp. EM0848]|uniref:helix-turn-helix domain-containing protein n=1 Tax=Sphingobium sp. EM0848 TaxID=2743473 RepID=UPI00159BFF1F
MSSDKKYAPTEQLVLLLRKAESVGLSATAILRECRFSYSFEDLLLRRVRHLPVTDFARISQHCVNSIRQVYVPAGITGLSREDFDLMCHALVTSSSLREVIQRQSRFFEICGRAYGWLDTIEADDMMRMGIHLGPVEEGWRTFFTLNAFLVFSRLFEWLIGQPVDPKYELVMGMDEESASISAVFGITVRYNGQMDGLIFPAQALDRPVVRDGVEMRQFLQSFPFDVLLPADMTVSLSAQVTALYRDAMLSARPLPNHVELAKRFGMSSATFRRHLESEGGSIREIKANIRYRVARELLAADNAHFDQVATILDFSGTKAFTRAFVEWSGTTPIAFRRDTLSRRGASADGSGRTTG